MSFCRKRLRLVLEFCLTTNKVFGNKQKARCGGQRKGNGLRTENWGNPCSDHPVELKPRILHLIVFSPTPWDPLLQPKIMGDFIVTSFSEDARN